jgi:hypothetical protein
MCKTLKGTRSLVVLLFLGVVLATFGIVNEISLPDSAHNMSRLMGIFTGLGASFIAVGVVRIIHQARTAPEKLREEEIELKDERNIQILRGSYTVSNAAAALMFAILVIVFSAMGSITESYICLGALLLQQVIFLIANHYFKKKM